MASRGRANTFGPGSVVTMGLGTLLAVLLLAYEWLLGSFSLGAEPWLAASKLVFWTLMPALLVVAGYRMRDLDIGPDDGWQMAMWAFGGLGALTLLTGWQFYLQSLGSDLSGRPIETMLLNAQAGAVGGLLVGYYYVQAHRNAEQAAAARDRFLFLNQVLRHNVLNAVQLMSGYAETVDGGDDPELAEFLDLTASQCDAITELVDNARALEQVTKGTEGLEPVDLATAVREEAAVLEDTFEAAAVSVDLPEHVYVYADQLLRALLENLFVNAVEHNDSESPHVWVDLDTDEETVRLRVADDGPGIPDDRKASVFEMDDDSGPHGLGLYLVQTLAAYYGGDVWVTDRDPRGSVFVVEFRRAGIDGTAGPSTAASASVADLQT